MNAPLLRELRQIYQSRSPEERPAAERDLREALKKLPKDVIQKVAQDDIGRAWRPNKGPQSAAYHCKADILLYGGAAGGGKSSLALGLAFTGHRNSLIMRRQYTDLSALTDEAIKINKTRKGFNGSIPPKLRTQDGRLIEFGACSRPGDEQSWQGRPHDLIVFDEGAQFLENQIRFLITWNRSTEEGQRCRVVIPSNPPIGIEGEWMLRFFAPWLDPMHSNPAKAGEIRWFITDENEKDHEVGGPELVRVGGRDLKPLSRTFIPAKLADNPYQDNAEYRARLDSLQEPYRSAMRDGNFMAGRRDAPNQLIPAQWLLDAQARWTPNPPPGVPMCAIGVDVAAGGEDETVEAIRHDGWYAPLIPTPGVRTPTGPDVAGLVISHRRDNATVIVDMGGGFGGSTFDHLKANEVEVRAYKGAESSVRRTQDKQLGFVNKRSEAYWKFREALDPSQAGGSPICLPMDPMLMADLSAPSFEVTPRGIKVETKEDVVKKLGRSCDRGDAVVMAWSDGSKAETHADDWLKGVAKRKRGRMPTVIRAHEAQRAFLRR